MSLIKFGLYIAGIIVIVIAGYLLFENRADSKILSKAFLPILIGAAGSIFTIVFQSQTKSDKEKYDYIHIIDRTTNEERFPFEEWKKLQMGEPSFMIIRNLMNDSTLQLNNPPMDKIIILRILESYHGWFKTSWAKTINRYSNVQSNETLTFTEHLEKSDFLTYNDIQFIDDSEFFIHYFKTYQPDFKIPVPKGTRIKYSKNNGLVITNKLYESIQISVNQLGGWTDNGRYLYLMYNSIDKEGFKSDFENKRYTYWTYGIHIESKENSLFRGNPKLEVTKEWTNNIKYIIESEFNNAKRLQKLIEINN
jgi:hypothetical protein